MEHPRKSEGLNSVVTLVCNPASEFHLVYDANGHNTILIGKWNSVQSTTLSAFQATVTEKWLRKKKYNKSL
jgi:hypothetical protein